MTPPSHSQNKHVWWVQSVWFALLVLWVKSWSQCLFEILHGPHSGRGSRQLLLYMTDTFEWCTSSLTICCTCKVHKMSRVRWSDGENILKLANRLGHVHEHHQKDRNVIVCWLDKWSQIWHHAFTMITNVDLETLHVCHVIYAKMACSWQENWLLLSSCRDFMVGISPLQLRWRTGMTWQWVLSIMFIKTGSGYFLLQEKQEAIKSIHGTWDSALPSHIGGNTRCRSYFLMQSYLKVTYM